MADSLTIKIITGIIVSIYPLVSIGIVAGGTVIALIALATGHFIGALPFIALAVATACCILKNVQFYKEMLQLDKQGYFKTFDERIETCTLSLLCKNNLL